MDLARVGTVGKSLQGRNLMTACIFIFQNFQLPLCLLLVITVEQDHQLLLPSCVVFVVSVNMVFNDV